MALPAGLSIIRLMPEYIIQTFNVNSILANKYQIQESSVTINPEEER